MPAFQYKAVNDHGRMTKGSISAANEIDLEERLKQLGLELIDCAPVKVRKAGTFSRVQLKDMIILCLHLEQLDRAGVPLLDALADVRESTESLKLRDIMTDIYESVKGGDMLSDAMSKHPKVFGRVFVGLVAAGEETGDLAEAFSQLTRHMKWVADIKRKVRKALGYPIMLGIVLSIVVTVLMMFVVPKLVDYLQAQGFDLPIHTRALIWVSDIFTDYWYLVFGAPIICIVSVIIGYRVSSNFAFFIDGLMLKLPALGSTLRKIDMARFSHFFAVMFRSGIDILDALNTSQEVINNRVLKDSIVLARRSVSEGSSLTAALRLTGQFPNLVTRMFKVGEESGNLNEALENINYFYDREVNDSVDRMVALIQPAMTFILGGIVLWVVAAVFGPLYETFSSMRF